MKAAKEGFDATDVAANTAERPTMQDIGKLVGVAPATVSRVFRLPHLVAAKTRERVLSAADRLGYVPNLVAGSLAAQRTRVVVVIVPTVEHSNFGTMLNGISEHLLAHGFETVIALSGSLDQREEDLVRTFVGRRPDGIVLTGTHHSQRTRDLLRKSSIPVVEVWNLTSDPIDMNVGFSNFDAAVAVTTHLISSGRRHIGMICGPRSLNDRARDRHAGFAATLAAHGLSSGLFEEIPDPAGVQLVADRLSRLFMRDPDVDAVFCSGDAYAMAAIFECQRRNWPVPSKIAVAGIGDAALASLMTPALTTAQVPGFEIGAKAAEMLLERFAGRVVAERIVDVGFKLVTREST